MCVDSGGYYETFNLPHVTLVDVGERPIERITACGLVVDGTEHRLDALVLATGFDAITGTLLRLDLRGRGGVRIQDKWRAGPLNYVGLMTAGFPNLFHIAGVGSSAAFTNVIVSIEHHVDWIANCIGHMLASGRASIEASEAAEAEWVAHVTAMAGCTVFMSCNSWYLGANISGKPRMFMPLVGGFPLYADKCAAVARAGYAGFVLAEASGHAGCTSPAGTRDLSATDRSIDVRISRLRRKIEADPQNAKIIKTVYGAG